MYIDKELEFSDEQAVTATAESTNYVDLGSDRSVGVGNDMQVIVAINEDAAAAGSATVVFSIECDDDSAFGSAKTVFATGAIAKAELVAGKQIAMPIPYDCDKRYVRVKYTVASGPLTAGKFSSAVVEGVQASKAYADAL